ncbi:MAG: nuclear transport factor 2 family protein [Acidimicrobiia bacterium]
MEDARAAARALVHQLVDAYNAKDLEGVAGLYAEDARYWSALEDWRSGLDEVRAHLQTLFETLPDEQMSIKALVTDGDTAVVEFESRGTSPDGNPYTIEFTEVLELRDHKIATAKVYLDPEEVERIEAS